MTNDRKLNLKKKFSSFFLIIFFIIFLIPYSLPGGFSANYSFILLPIFLILLTGKFKKPNRNIILIVSFFFLIFILGTIFQFELFQHLDRRFFSFIIFMTIFSYIVIDIDKETITAFKIAVVLIVLYIVTWKISKFYTYSAAQAEGHYGNLKFYIGSSRYGFVYLLAFWIIVFYKPTTKLILILKYSAILLIIAGIFITYSRTTIISLVLSSGFFYLNNFIFSKRKFFSKIFFLILIPIIFLVLVNLSQKYFSNTFNYFSETLFAYLSIDGFIALSERLSNLDSSEGFRFDLWGKAIHYVSLTPLIGSGFLGCWIMYEDMVCSAHNQYVDVLFRVGFLGFYLYLLILFQVFNYLKNQHRDLLYGFISILIFGFFHETFKLSQGAFILTFMIGMMMTYQRNKYNEKNVS